MVGLFTEEEDGEIGVLPRVTVADYFTSFEAIIGYRTTPRPGYVPKKAYDCHVREFRMLRLIGVSASSLYRESTDSISGGRQNDT